jgi:cytochrome d ubiquinol oxidase subunit II
MNQVQWRTSWYGLEAVLNIQNIVLGLVVLFLARTNGLLYIINSIEEDELIVRSRKKLLLNAGLFLIFFLYFIISLLFSKGFAADRITGAVTMERFKYLHNFVQMPVVSLLFLAGVAGVLYGIISSLFRNGNKGIWFSGTGTVLVVFSLFLIAGFNGTSFYPSVYDLQSSLTISNASSSLFTLKTMMYVSFVIPFVFAYIFYAWKVMSNTKITEAEMNSDEHGY